MAQSSGTQAHTHTETQTHTHTETHTETQTHPLSTYLWIWGWLFVLSTMSYMVDIFQLQGLLRWSLILIFMMLKAGLIVAIFMHVKWERLALTFVILAPPIFVLVFTALMVAESDYTHATREVFLP